VWDGTPLQNGKGLEFDLPALQNSEEKTMRPENG
jgi:hypothetical protein